MWETEQFIVTLISEAQAFRCLQPHNGQNKQKDLKFGVMPALPELAAALPGGMPTQAKDTGRQTEQVDKMGTG